MVTAKLSILTEGIRGLLKRCICPLGLPLLTWPLFPDGISNHINKRLNITLRDSVFE